MKFTKDIACKRKDAACIDKPSRNLKKIPKIKNANGLLVREIFMDKHENVITLYDRITKTGGGGEFNKSFVLCEYFRLRNISWK